MALTAVLSGRRPSHAHEPCEAEHDPPGHPPEGTDRVNSAWGIVFIFIPLIIGLTIPAKPLSASAVSNRGISSGAPLSAGGGSQAANISQSSDQRTILDWVKLFNYQSDLSNVLGQKADVIGFVYHDPRLSAGQFMVSRFAITCCVADAFAIGMVVESTDAEGLPDNSWIRVKGPVQSINLGGHKMALILADSIRPPRSPSSRTYSPRFQMNRLDLRAGSMILAVLLALVGVTAMGSQIGVQVHLTGPVTQDILQVGPKGPISFEFSRPVQEDRVSPVVSFDPPLPGKLTWDDFTHASFVPDEPLRPNVIYTVTVGKGVVGRSGEKIQNPISWRFELRDPLVIYLSGDLGAANLWTSGLAGNPPPRQITRAPGAIWDYAPAPNGEQIMYSMINSENGMDLWTVGRDGQGNHILLNCGPDQCSTISWCQNSQRIVYNRQGAGISPEAPLGAPRPWLLDTKTGETKPLYEDQQVIGYAPAWSPDCQKVASFDGINGGIQILDLQTKKNVFVPSISGMGGNWSPDSQSLYFTNVLENGTDFDEQVFKANADTGQTQRIFTSQQLVAVTNFDNPAMSPKGDWLAAGVRNGANIPGSQIWLISEDGQKIQAVTHDPNFTYDEYSWDPWGDRLVFRGLKLASSQGGNMTSVWVAHSGQVTLIADNATMPFWLP